MMRQAKNIVFIEGILSETNLKHGSYTNDGKTMECINGTCKIRVELPEKTIEVPVFVFVNKYGRTNPNEVLSSYANMEQVMNEFVSLGACNGNKEVATKVRVSRGSLCFEEYDGADGNPRTRVGVRSSFISRVNSNFTPTARFEVEGFLKNFYRVTDFEGAELEPTKLEINLVVPGYNNSVILPKLYATSQDVINLIENNWEIGKTYSMAGLVDFSTETRTRTKTFDIGDPIVESYTIYKQEFVVNRLDMDAMDEELSYTVSDIKEAVANYNARKENKNKKPISKPNFVKRPEVDLGF